MNLQWPFFGFMVTEVVEETEAKSNDINNILPSVNSSNSEYTNRYQFVRSRSSIKSDLFVPTPRPSILALPVSRIYLQTWAIGKMLPLHPLPMLQELKGWLTGLMGYCKNAKQISNK